METVRTDDKPTVRYGIQKSPSRWVLALRVTEVHIGAFAALLFFPINRTLFWLFLGSYAIRMWGAEACHHRYFAHRAFRAGRGMQLVLAIIACLAGQRGPLWWAATHYVHHRNADTPDDPHSPLAHSFWTAHAGWFLKEKHLDTNLDLVPGYAKYPELRWLNAHYAVPFFGSAVLLFVLGHFGLLGPNVGGLAAMCWGAFLPSMLSLNFFSLVNSLGHIPNAIGGYRRYNTKDGSTNRPLLAIMTFGTGWHNNHHRYAASARAGFAWYEFDITYYTLRVLELLGLVSDLRPVPPRILEEGGLQEGTRPAAHSEIAAPEQPRQEAEQSSS